MSPWIQNINKETEFLKMENAVIETNSSLENKMKSSADLTGWEIRIIKLEDRPVETSKPKMQREKIWNKLNIQETQDNFNMGNI